jgi:hypothetical protein
MCDDLIKYVFNFRIYRLKIDSTLIQIYLQNENKTPKTTFYRDYIA